ncbi:MAG: HAD family phosphatase [Bacteroidota bacterium]|nr:HAD family phosphatase [Bacteroidota bacterium]
MSNIKAIVFDLGNVLVKIDYKPLLVHTGLNGKFSEEEVYNLLENPAIAYESGKLSSHEFYNETMRMLQINIDYEKFVHAWCSVATVMVENIEEVVIELARQYPLYLLSNTNELHLHHIKKNYPILENFQRLFLSYKIGVMKPDEEIFQFMLNELEIEPEDIFFIDDKITNVESAFLLGIDAVHFQSTNELRKVLTQKYILSAKK